MISDFASDSSWWYASRFSVPNPLSVSLPPASLEALRSGAVARPKDVRSEFVAGIATRHDLSPDDVSYALFHNDFMSKWKFGCSTTKKLRRDVALDGFHHRNQLAQDKGRIPTPMRSWMREFLSRALPEVGDDWVCTGRFGPGEVFERWTRLQRLVALTTWVNSPAWRSSFRWQQPPRYLPFPSDVTHADANRSACRLCAVPKDVTKDRLITVEPAYRSFLQQRVRELLLVSLHCGSLRGTACDLGWRDVPSIQRRRALSASKDGSLATIDLSDASDHITWSAVREVFPCWVVRLLDESRSHECVDPRNQQKTCLNIFAGMGNATTFVIETLFFSAAVYAMGRCFRVKTRHTVFGDDIIAANAILGCLPAMENFMVVNARKTFSGIDSIRESCGVYAYKGVDVTFPHVRGFSSDWDGAMGLCGWYRKWRGSRLWNYYVSNCCHTLGLPNWPCDVEGYPSISSDQIEYDALPRQRIHPEYQSLEFQLKCHVAKATAFLPRPGVSTLFGKYHVREDEVAYLGYACGMIRPSDVRITGDPTTGRELRISDVGRVGYIVQKPNGYRIRSRWCRCTPSASDPTGDGPNWHDQDWSCLGSPPGTGVRDLALQDSAVRS